MLDLPRAVRRARERWEYWGQKRPDFAEKPGPGQESVWDYPRPPRMESDVRRVEVRSGGVLVAESRRALRVLETASPPTFYLPRDDVRVEYLVPSERGSFCEWKGRASYWSLRIGEQFIEAAGWSYPSPLAGYEAIANYLSFYPSRTECRVDGRLVEAQPGGFYGGWVTPEIVGPFKGDPGTDWW